MSCLLAMLAARCLPAPKPIYSLGAFLEELSTVLDDSVERNFFATDADSLYLVCNTVCKEIESLMPLISPHSELHTYLDTIGVREVQVYWLAISYYLYGNGEKIENEIIQEVYKRIRFAEKIYEYNKTIKTKIKNTKLNDSYFMIGDTVHASVYISPDTYIDPFMYAKGRMQYFESTAHGKLARFSGIILEKGCWDLYTYDPDSTCFYYRLQLLTWDRDIALSPVDELGAGDTVDFFLVAYGRLFDNYPARLIP